MPLVFAGLTPHPPLLIPNIGKEKTEKLKATKAAFEQLERELYGAKPQILIVITPHESLFEDTFTINAHPALASHFEEFGDMATKKEWRGTPYLAAKIEHRARRERVRIRLVSNPYLGYGASVPLYYLTSHTPNTHILPIGYSGLPKEDHVRFGQLLKEIIMESDKRIAVIASGDLSHTLAETSPAGFHAHGKLFDALLQERLAEGNLQSIVEIEEHVIKNAAECMSRSLLILAGILDGTRPIFKTYCYESPFGVGYLTGEFVW